MGETKIKMRKGLWSPDEDEKLSRCIAMYMNGSWSDIARKAGLQRCGKSCRRRWMNHLRPDLKRGRFTPTEIGRVVELHNALGNRWSEIAGHLVGRTDNDVKNLWNTQIKRQLKLQQISSAHNNTPTSSSTGAAAPSAPHVEGTGVQRQLMDYVSAAGDSSTSPPLSDIHCMMQLDAPTLTVGMAQEDTAPVDDTVKLQSTKSISKKSVFTFPFSCIPAHQHLHVVEQAEPKSEELDTNMSHGAQLLNANINIPHALSSSNLSKLASAPPRHDEIVFTDDHLGKQLSPRDADELVHQSAGPSCNTSMSSSITTSCVANRTQDDDISSSPFQSSADPGKRGTILMQPPIVQLQLRAGQHDATTNFLYKDEKQRLSKLPALPPDERHSTLMPSWSTVGDAGELQNHSSCGQDSSRAVNNNNVAGTDSDGTTSLSSISTGASSDVEDVYIIATGASCSATWWSSLDVDLQVPDFQLPDAECWQPLADMFEL